jgi:uncharacterized damage-inducible protein DinB
MIDRGYVRRNDAERARLKALVAKCSDADLARPMPAGWTVAGVLGHLAFWDQRILALLDQWESAGIAPPPHHDGDVDWINDATKPMLLAVPPRKAAELSVAIAETVDRRVAAISDDLVARNARAGSPLNLDRGVHRREHLDDIDRVLSERR